MPETQILARYEADGLVCEITCENGEYWFVDTFRTTEDSDPEYLNNTGSLTTYAEAFDAFRLDLDCFFGKEFHPTMLVRNK
jgi:hypothetical protein